MGQERYLRSATLHNFGEAEVNEAFDNAASYRTLSLD